MNPQVIYQTSIARNDELRRQADRSRLATEIARGRRPKSSRRRFRAWRGLRPSMSERFA